MKTEINFLNCIFRTPFKAIKLKNLSCYFEKRRQREIFQIKVEQDFSRFSDIKFNTLIFL